MVRNCQQGLALGTAHNSEPFTLFANSLRFSMTEFFPFMYHFLEHHQKLSLALMAQFFNVRNTE